MIELKQELISFLDSLTFVNNSDLVAQINKFLRVKSELEFIAKQLKPDHSFFKDLCLLNDERVDILFHDSISPRDPHPSFEYHSILTDHSDKIFHNHNVVFSSTPYGLQPNLCLGKCNGFNCV